MPRQYISRKVVVQILVLEKDFSREISMNGYLYDHLAVECVHLTCENYII